jgi:hypothetical protein
LKCFKEEKNALCYFKLFGVNDTLEKGVSGIETHLVTEEVKISSITI